MASHDDNTLSLPFVDGMAAAQEEDGAVRDDFYEGSIDVDDDEVSAESDYAAEKNEEEEEEEEEPAEEGLEQDPSEIPPQEDQNPEVGDDEVHGHDGVLEDQGAKVEDPNEKANRKNAARCEETKRKFNREKGAVRRLDTCS